MSLSAITSFLVKVEFLFYVFIIIQVNGECDDGWIKFEKLAKCYKTHDVKSTFQLAREVCKESDDAQLLTIETKDEENYFIQKILANLETKYDVWVDQHFSGFSSQETRNNCIVIKLQTEENDARNVHYISCAEKHGIVCQKKMKLVENDSKAEIDELRTSMKEMKEE